MKVAVIGNGVVGASIAFRLSRQAKTGDQIVVVGKKTRVGSATLAAAAMLNSFAEIEVGSLDGALDRHRFALSRRATAMWPAFGEELMAAAADGDPTWRPFASGERALIGYGTYIVNNTAADDLDDANFDAIISALDEFEEPWHAVSPREIPNYMPEQQHRATRAFWMPREGWLNPRTLIDALDTALGASAVVRGIDGDAKRLVRDGGAIVAVELDDGERIEADVFIVATGAATTELFSRSALGLPIQRIFYGVGVSIEIRSPDYRHTHCVRTPNRGLACGVYSAPYLGRDGNTDHILIGASNFISPVPYHYGRLTSVESLLRAGIEQINSGFYRADFVRMNVGWRPTSLDTYPVIGRTSLPNLVVATGTKRDGIHMAPLLSEAIARVVHGGAAPEFDVFAPERAPIRALTREQGIEKGVRHLMSASYQHGFVPAKSRMVDQVRAMYRQTVERLHDQVGAHDWGLPPEMHDMYRYGHANSAHLT